MRRFGSIGVFVILVIGLVVASLEGRETPEQWSFLLKNAMSTVASSPIASSPLASSPAMSQVHMAEQLLMNCGRDLMHMKGSFKSLNLLLSEVPICSKDTISKKQLSSKGDLRKVMSILPPETKQILLDCSRKHNLEFHVSGEEDGSKRWYRHFLQSIFGWSDFSRRCLRVELLGVTETPGLSPISQPPGLSPISQPPSYGPAPSSDIAPYFGPAPHSGQAPISSHVPNPQPPAKAPGPYFFPPYHNSDVQPSASDLATISPGLAPDPSSRKHDKTRTVVIAVVVTAGLTLFFAAVLFCCYNKYRKSPQNGPKDEGPLLALNLSDYSIGASQKSFLANSGGKDTFASVSHSNPSQNGRHSLSDASVGDAKVSVESPAILSTVGDLANPLKPPPGRIVPPAPGPPPPPPPRPPLPPRPYSAPPAPKPPPGPPPPPPIPSGIKPGPRPPPPPVGGGPPRPLPTLPIKSKVIPPSPLGPNYPGNSSDSPEAPKTKLKPFFWDKVLANPDQSMVWHQISSGSFQFNEEMIENLFGYNATEKNKGDRKKEFNLQVPSMQYIQIIDSKKAQNLSILLRALNVTIEEVCDALHEGTELPMELLQTLLKMAPTSEEELKLRLYSGDLSQLGPTERFLKVLVNIPFAFKRLDSLCFMSSLQEEVSSIKESLETLEVACKELRSSRLFLKLLEAVLKTGNRMNDGTFRGGAQAFKLDTLLKLADVKGTDGKTTLLHFVVQAIIRSEGLKAARAARERQSLSSVKSEELVEDVSPRESEDYYRSLGLDVVLCLSGELDNVKKASVVDADGLAGIVCKLGDQLIKSKEFLNSEMKSSEEVSGFRSTLESFIQNAEVDITWLLGEEKRIMALVKNTADYFHGNARKDEGLRLFVIVRDFLIMIDNVCREVREATVKAARTPRNKESPSKAPSTDVHQRLFPAIMDRRLGTSSDEED